MSDLNHLVLEGRLVRDAVFRTTKNEKKVALFTFAVNKTRKAADGSFYDEVYYFPTSTFVNSEKFASYLKKGQPVIVEGYLKQKSKEIGTDETGRKLYDSKLYICTTKLRLIFTGKKESEQANEIPDEINEEIYIENAESSTEDFYMEDENVF